ncbi:hypothetical protein [Gordonia liuliyuniae]|uniref:MmpS family membrane protein n=1 Tax=Gordonia liuliyuniae TaxID=2911517 RepID=A0ABS9ITF0_9ACTN|nr:hypothetical protein [Gordonia liuliyuniae]MCF8588777.1 hypothetical protein [Gordonia liuliyuniae]
MSNRSTARTAVLSVVVIVALIALIVVAVLVVRDKTSSTSGAAPATTTVPATSESTRAPTSTTSTTSTPASTPTTPESTHTRPTGEPGTVIYQLTGDGDVVGVGYRAGSRSRVVVVTGTPWQQRTTVVDRRAEVSGIVVRGRITCTIMQGEELLASSTSGVGPFSCRATLPR